MDETHILEKSFLLSVNITEIYKMLVYEKKEYFLSKQVVRTGTYICAVLESIFGGYMSDDFLEKLILASKEIRETKYWLRLLYEAGYINAVDSLIADCDELSKLLSIEDIG